MLFLKEHPIHNLLEAVYRENLCSMKNFNFVIDILIKLGIILVLIIAASFEHQYSYYIFVRWSITFTLIYFAYKAFTENHIGLLILFGSIALLFNPFYKFAFQRETWKLIDYIISGMILLTILYDWKKSKI